MQRFRSIVAFLAIAGFASIATPAPAADVLPTAALKGAPGFTTPAGMTVYTWDTDKEPDKSACVDACAKVWPPVPAPSGVKLAAPWSSFTRADGTQQLAYKGSPLYTFARDTAAGQTNGDGAGSGATWRIARPATAPAPSAKPSAAARPNATPMVPTATLSGY